MIRFKPTVHGLLGTGKDVFRIVPRYKAIKKFKAFMPGQEHYQHWIDSGMFAMSVIYALHSLGVASCCLNWSQSPASDKKLRSCLDIKDNHTIIMMLAIGLPKENNNACISARRPLDEFYSKLEPKDVKKI